MEISEGYNAQTNKWDESVGFAFDGANAESKAPGSERAQGETLGQDSFFKLLTTQLASQDPLEPMDDTAFIAQMAQFSTLEMQSTLNKNFESYSNNQGFIGAQSMIGNKVSLLSEGQHVEGIAQGIEKKGDELRVFVNGKSYDIGSINRVDAANVTSSKQVQAGG